MGNQHDTEQVDFGDLHEDDDVLEAPSNESVSSNAEIGTPHTGVGTPPKNKGGRPKGSRNKPKEAQERQYTPAGAGLGRPAGRTGEFPQGDAARLPQDADLLWMHIISEIAEQDLTPYDMEIRVGRITPPPATTVATIDGGSVVGDGQAISPATALRDYMIDYVYLPMGIEQPARFELWFCWRNTAKFFRRGELQLPSRRECIALRQAAYARAAAQGVGAPYTPYALPPTSRQGTPPSATQQQPQQQPQLAVPPYYPPMYGFGAPPASETFDREAERARIRMEMEREFEMERLRREVAELRQRPQYPPQYPPAYRGRPRQGLGAADAGPPYAGSPFDYQQLTAQDVAQIVVQTIQQMGGARTGLGAPSENPVVAAASGTMDDLEHAVSTFSRFKKFKKVAKEIFADEDEEEERHSKRRGVGAEGEEEEGTPQLRFQPTGTFWKDSRPVMLPIDKKGNPVLPTDMPSAMATVFANPALIEPIMPALGAIAQRFVGVGAPPPSGVGAPPPSGAGIQVQPAAVSEIQVQPAPNALGEKGIDPSLGSTAEDDDGWKFT
jgi:hypothetical protein